MLKILFIQTYGFIFVIMKKYCRTWDNFINILWIYAGLKLKMCIEKKSYFSTETHVVSTQKNHLNFEHPKLVKTEG